VQDQIKLPYNLHVMGGIRYQYIHQQGSTTNLTGNVTPDAALTADAVTPRVGLLWQAKDWLSLYSNYTENFGANTGLVFPNKAAPPSSAQQWEFGAKTEFFGGRLRSTLAYFDLTKQNVATNDPDLTHVCGGGQCSLVTGEVRSRGPELDIQGEILPGWNVIATYANRDVRITKSNNNDEGFRLWNSPRNMASLWNTYDFQQEALRGVKIGGGVTLRDGVTDQTNTVNSPGYATVDLLAAYHVKVGKSKVTTQLNVNNLLDRDSFTTITAVPSLNTAQGSYLTPRTFMGSIRVEY
jgi:iron complex outermembrane receptor protein